MKNVHITNTHKGTTLALLLTASMLMAGCSHKETDADIISTTESQMVTESAGTTESLIESTAETGESSSIEESSTAWETEEDTRAASEEETSGKDKQDKDDKTDKDSKDKDDKSDNDKKDKDSSAKPTEKPSEAAKPTEPQPSTTAPTKAPEPSKAPESTAATKPAVTVTGVTASVNGGTRYIGDSLSAADFKVGAVMSDGSTDWSITGWSADPLKLSGASTTVKVSYQGFSTTVTVSAQERPKPTEPAPQPTPAPTQPAPAPAPTEPETFPTDPEGFYSGGYWFDTDGYCLEYAKEMFRLQNEERVAAGSQPLVWKDDIYERAKLCAKAISTDFSHDATLPYCRDYPNADGMTLDENIVCGQRMDPATAIEVYRTSNGHWRTLLYGENDWGAIGAYYAGGKIYVSNLYFDSKVLSW